VITATEVRSEVSRRAIPRGGVGVRASPIGVSSWYLHYCSSSNKVDVALRLCMSVSFPLACWDDVLP
jgi:hypothetical protein